MIFIFLILEREGKTGANRFDDEIKRGKLLLFSRRLEIRSLNSSWLDQNCVEK